MAQHELAQLNIGRPRGRIDSPLMADFVNALDRINALAEASPGFVWRLQDDSGNATGLRPLGDDTIVNMSVWKDVEALHAFVYRSDHIDVMRRRREWFEKMDLYMVLWWVPRGHRPTMTEAIERLEVLRERGPTPEAFTFRVSFPPPDTKPAADAASFDEPCPAT